MNENTEARMLLERALGTEPELGLDAEKVLARARRDARNRRSTMLGGASVAVAVIAVAAVFITTPHSPDVIDPAVAPTVRKCVPSVSPSEPPTTTLSSPPPTSTSPPLVAGMCVP